MLFRTFGAAFAVSVMGTVMLSKMQDSLALLRAANPAVDPRMWAKLANPQNLLEPLTRAQISADLLPKLITSLSDALWYAFLAGFVLMLFGLIASCYMANTTPANTPRNSERA
jgi:hypothetical protein